MQNFESTPPYEPSTSPELRIHEILTQTFETHSKVYVHADIEMATLDEFISARPDIESAVANIYMSMEQAGLDPAIVITPVKLSLDRQITLATNMTADKTIPNNPLKRNNDGNGLYVSDWQTEHYDELQRQSQDYLISKNATIVTKAEHNTDGTPGVHLNTTLDWCMAVISATDRPQNRNKSYNDINGETCTFLQYNILQFSRIWQGLPPIDQDNRTWQHGKVRGVSPNGGWVQYGGHVYARSDGSSDRYLSYGCRSPGVV